MDIPHGPRRIGPKNQISLPSELLDRVQLATGDEVFVALNLDVPGTLIVIPADLLAGVPFRLALQAIRDQAEGG